MALSSCIEISDLERLQLLDIARRSIECGLSDGEALFVDGTDLNGALAAARGVFVTLIHLDSLRGCMGALESSDPLAQTVAVSAFNAAFKDARFSQLTAAEMTDISIEISVLSEMEPLVVSHRENLLQQLRPNQDGLLLQDGRHRSTFLPKVWEKITAPEVFLDHLLSKAGLPADHWTETIRFFRYHTISFAEE